jgi:hypothetical protein
MRPLRLYPDPIRHRPGAMPECLTRRQLAGPTPLSRETPTIPETTDRSPT